MRVACDCGKGFGHAGREPSGACRSGDRDGKALQRLEDLAPASVTVERRQEDGADVAHVQFDGAEGAETAARPARTEDVAIRDDEPRLVTAVASVQGKTARTELQVPKVSAPPRRLPQHRIRPHKPGHCRRSAGRTSVLTARHDSVVPTDRRRWRQTRCTEADGCTRGARQDKEQATRFGTEQESALLIPLRRLEVASELCSASGG